MAIVVNPEYPGDIKEIQERTNLSKKQYVEYATLVFNDLEKEERIHLIFEVLQRASTPTQGTATD